MTREETRAALLDLIADWRGYAQGALDDSVTCLDEAAASRMRRESLTWTSAAEQLTQRLAPILRQDPPTAEPDAQRLDRDRDEAASEEAIEQRQAWAGRESEV